MESNGKSVDLNGNAIEHSTSPIVWGAVGTNGQHSFHQLLHQGTRSIAIDFIATLKPLGKTTEESHRRLLSHCLSQRQILMKGKSAETLASELQQQSLSLEQANNLAKHKSLAGNRPNNLLICDALTPEALGSLITLYEHKVYTQSVLWSINAFDQWGVELGKDLSKHINRALETQNYEADFDPSTLNLIKRYQKNNK